MKLRCIDFVTIRLVAECANLGSLVSAAHRCSITTGAASRRLSIFEDLLNCQIFRRSFKGLDMTEEGEFVVAACRQLLDGIEQLTQIPCSLKSSLPVASDKDMIAS
jgi:DNA-binding transcriptional LysR family regulator